MGKGFKLKLSRLIPSFQSCRSKDPSSLPSNPVPSFVRLPPAPVNPNNVMSFNPHYNLPSPLSRTPTPPPSSKPLNYSSIKRHVSSALTSIGCGSRSRSFDAVPSETEHTRSPPQGEEEFFHWEKEEKFHVVAKSIYSTPRRKIYHDTISLSSPPLVPVPPNTDNDEETKKKKRRRPKHRKKATKADRYASETETLVEKGRTATTRRPKRCVLAKTAGRRRKKNSSSSCSCSEYEKDTSLSGNTTPARLSKFQWMIPCAVQGKVRESFAVVKRSEDPYEDFKRSMTEMVLEKGMFEEEDLEQLLHCFLSLNDRDHHGVIVRAFSEVWHALFV